MKASNCALNLSLSRLAADTARVLVTITATLITNITTRKPITTQPSIVTAPSRMRSVDGPPESEPPSAWP